MSNNEVDLKCDNCNKAENPDADIKNKLKQWSVQNNITQSHSWDATYF